MFRDFGSLIDAFTAAAIDPSLWGAAMDAAVEGTGSLVANLVPMRGRMTPFVPRSQSIERSMDQFFREGWDKRDERAHWIPAVMQNGVGIDYDFKSPEEMARHRFFCDFLRYQGMRWFAGVKIGDGDDVWALCLHRSAEQGPYSPTELQRLAELSRALAGTARLAVAFGFTRIEAKLSVFDRSIRPSL